MTLPDWIAAERQKILADARHHYPPADVFVNAPLALIQVAMKSRLQALDEMIVLLAEEKR